MEIQDEITQIITHDNCGDGLGSALVLQACFPKAEIVFAQHNTHAYKTLVAQPGMLFCDIIPPEERAQEFVDAGAYVLDHHLHAEHVVALFKERGVFAHEDREPGVSGTTLAFREVMRPRHAGSPMGLLVPYFEFAVLCGVRDTWQTGDPRFEAAQELHLTLMNLPRSFWLEQRDGAGNPYGVVRALDLVYMGVGRHMGRAQRAAVQGVFRKQECAPLGDWVLTALPASMVSDAAEEARGLGYRVLVNVFLTFDRGVHKAVFSLRSDGSVDVGALAKAWGGGGHTKAAGFSKIGWDSPVATVMQLRDAAEELAAEPEKLLPSEA